MTKSNIPQLHCKRCSHYWFQRSNKKPKCCPGCHSPYWAIPRKENPNDGITADDI